MSGEPLKDQENAPPPPMEEEATKEEGGSAAKPAKFESKTKLKVNIRSWNGVCTWKWVANDDTCGKTKAGEPDRTCLKILST